MLEDLMLTLGRPMRFSRQRHPRLERWLGLDLAPSELASVLQGCAADRVPLGAYYWYFQKLVMARLLRRRNKREILAKITSLDQSNYEQLLHAEMLAEGRGLVVAIPHHGHYILSIVALAERLRSRRQVLIFYGAPATHSGNELFDELYRVLFESVESNVVVIHDTRQGLSSAIRSLKEGAAVIIMPDVHKRESDTYLIPFCERPLNVMLGTAALARKTGAAIIPAVSVSNGNRLGFETHFASALELEDATPHPSNHDAVDIIHRDYKLTAKLFRIYERSMSASIIHWQHVRMHYARVAPFPKLAENEIENVAELFFNDVRVRSLGQAAIRISDTGSSS